MFIGLVFLWFIDRQEIGMFILDTKFIKNLGLEIIFRPSFTILSYGIPIWVPQQSPSRHLLSITLLLVILCCLRTLSLFSPCLCEITLFPFTLDDYVVAVVIIVGCDEMVRCPIHPNLRGKWISQPKFIIAPLPQLFNKRLRRQRMKLRFNINLFPIRNARL